MAGKSPYSDDFKRQVVAAAADRGMRTLDDVGKDYGVSGSVISLWRKQFGDQPEQHTRRTREEEPNDRTGYSRQEQAAARREANEVERLRSERDQLAMEAAALRKTIVLLGRSG